jgi:hypothetical protein
MVVKHGCIESSTRGLGFGIVSVALLFQYSRTTFGATGTQHGPQGSQPGYSHLGSSSSNCMASHNPQTQQSASGGLWGGTQGTETAPTGPAMRKTVVQDKHPDETASGPAGSPSVLRGVPLGTTSKRTPQHAGDGLDAPQVGLIKASADTEGQWRGHAGEAGSPGAVRREVSTGGLLTTPYLREQNLETSAHPHDGTFQGKPRARLVPREAPPSGAAEDCRHVYQNTFSKRRVALKGSWKNTPHID